MSKKDPKLALLHMRDFARDVIEITRNRTRADLDTDRLFNLALARLIELIGEAATRIPAEERARMSGIPWPKLIGMRNRLIHGYDFIDQDVIWETTTEDIPVLIKVLETILK